MHAGNLDDIARAHGIELLVQFGSTVGGTRHAQSDLDLAVLLRRSPESLLDLADLSMALQPLFPGQDIDLALLNHADPLLLKQITDCGVLLYGSPARWQELRLYAFKRYQDHRRFFAMEREWLADTAARAANAPAGS